MAELQSCSSKCSLGFEAQQLVSQLSAELKREKQKNAELMERICLLEAQIQQRERAYQEMHSIATDKSLKRQRTESKNNAVEDAKTAQSGELVPEIKHVNLHSTPEDISKQNCLLNWRTMDNPQFLDVEKLDDADSAANCNDTDDSDEDDEYCDEDDAKISDSDWKNKINASVAETSKVHIYEGVDVKRQIQYLRNPLTDLNALTVENVKEEVERSQNKELLLPHIRYDTSKKGLSIHGRQESKMAWGCKELLETQIYGQAIEYKGHGSISSLKKPPKVPFCPKEVNRIIGLEELQLKNAQSHTIRKLVVFASLGIRHGCEDMYELEFNHFSILQKGEPYVSPKNPGEHVLYEHPGTQRKVFYPNTQNPTLCPVHILEEEKTMRPLDANCPSCLFLCIKYGGRTRNLPQNEYVRQRMGKNKLKSFGPLMCKMAMLIHIRSGSFFFKALGITLLFMHGFSDELVQRETKYRNLDLLQKYYRKDDDAAADELFHLHPIPYDTASPSLPQLAGKAIKSSGKKQTGPACKPATFVPSVNAPSSSAPSTQFGLMGYVSHPTHAVGSFQSIPSQTTTQTTNPLISTSSYNLPYHATGQIPSPYSLFPPYPTNAFMPLLYWSHPNSFPNWYPYPSPTPYGCPPFPPGNSIPEPPSFAPSVSKVVQDSHKYMTMVGEANSNSEGGSTSTKSKKPWTS